jgi:hypothetical protein
LADRFDDVRSWVAEVRACQFLRLEIREVNHRVIGKNSVPVAAWIDSVDDALRLIGKRKDSERFISLVNATKLRHPTLLQWMARRPLQVMALQKDWLTMLDLADWILRNPRPGLFLRQVDIPGVHTKFIEANRGVLKDIFDNVLPLEFVEQDATGIAAFDRRYGFREKPVRIRFRILDPSLFLIKGGGLQDTTVDLETFVSMSPGVSRVFITENETNYLAFDYLPGSMVVFGAGYGLGFLSKASWLLGCEVFYWGDIDTHGFAILSAARSQVPQLKSILMDEDTLQVHMAYCVAEDTQHGAEILPNLTCEEQALYINLKRNTFGPNVRLEQELIRWDYAWKTIAGVWTGSDCEWKNPR